ncbi:hypothetical protein SmJEL517_g00370 [Synchytrium microbalum]|uniref:Nucleotidyl transferase domain-containing protein n=1 Tax=Synchytrium microbalum TaxID=1806994 RepID=A0A507CF79_9FUNG|nr:uncharacterized protein SmJEL517_g00370 [Synchytrium microbalum]TPX38151.1 hypothetical protein SmJEL517_g00370 [Synchytrium microbalum]
MKVLFLCGGYGTRLLHDLHAEPSQEHKTLIGIAKALLPLNNKPLIDYWLSDVKKLPPSIIDISKDVYVICNQHNYGQFTVWAEQQSFSSAHILNDGSTSNDTRLGAIVDMALAVEKFSIQEDLLIVAGDTLFLKDFSLEGYLDKASATPGSLVTTYTVKDEETRKTGIVVLEDEGGRKRVTALLEKPDPSETTSRTACPCFYYLKKDALPLLKQFVNEKSALEGLEAVDATGRFISWLVSRHPVYSYSIRGRLDIGGLASLLEAEAYLKS